MILDYSATGQFNPDKKMVVDMGRMDMVEFFSGGL